MQQGTDPHQELGCEVGVSNLTVRDLLGSPALYSGIAFPIRFAWRYVDSNYEHAADVDINRTDINALELTRSVRSVAGPYVTQTGLGIAYTYGHRVLRGSSPTLRMQLLGGLRYRFGLRDYHYGYGDAGSVSWESVASAVIGADVAYVLGADCTVTAAVTAPVLSFVTRPSYAPGSSEAANDDLSEWLRRGRVAGPSDFTAVDVVCNLKWRLLPWLGASVFGHYSYYHYDIPEVVEATEIEGGLAGSFLF